MPRRTISVDELDQFQVDGSDRLFWRGKAVVLEQRLTLKGWELAIASMAAFGALLAGVHPFLKSFGLIG